MQRDYVCFFRCSFCTNFSLQIDGFFFLPFTNVSDLDHFSNAFVRISEQSAFIRVRVFANYVGFHFDKSEKVKDLQIQFWSQLEKLKPETYLGDTNILLFATKNEYLFNKVLNSLGK